jgi:TonB family protein
MKSLMLLASLFAFIAPCVAAPATRSGGVHTGASLQVHNTKEEGEDRVYTPREVDERARITNKLENPPRPGSDCPSQGTVKLKMILHRSGEVRGVTIIEGIGCSYDGATVEAARGLKFKPAVKGGRPVSQYQIFMYSYY